MQDTNKENEEEEDTELTGRIVDGVAGLADVLDNDDLAAFGSEGNLEKTTQFGCNKAPKSTLQQFVATVG